MPNRLKHCLDQCPLIVNGILILVFVCNFITRIYKQIQTQSFWSVPPGDGFAQFTRFWPFWRRLNCLSYDWKAGTLHSSKVLTEHVLGHRSVPRTKKQFRVPTTNCVGLLYFIFLKIIILLYDHAHTERTTEISRTIAGAFPAIITATIYFIA